MAYIRKITRQKGVTYKAEVALRDGSKRAKSFRTKEEAQRWARGQEDQKASLKSFGVADVRMTLDEYFEKWIEGYAKLHHSAGWQITDRHMYERFVKPIIGMRLLREIQPADVLSVLQRMLKQGKAKSYANRIRSMMHKIFNEAVKTDRYLVFNPVSNVKPFKEDPFHAPHLKENEARQLLEWADSHPFGIALHLGLCLGLREGEILGLKWDVIDLEQKRIEIRRKFERKTQVIEEFTKGKKIRVLGIYPQGLVDRLRKQRALYPNAEFVVCRRDGGMISFMSLVHTLKCGVRDTGIGHVTIHGLRHTFASIYMQNKGDLYDLQKVLGHQSAKTTERYRHTDPDYLRAKCDVFNLYEEKKSVTRTLSAQTPPGEQLPLLRLIESGR